MCAKLHNKLCLGESGDTNETSGNVKMQMMELTGKRRDNEEKQERKHDANEEAHCHESRR